MILIKLIMIKVAIFTKIMKINKNKINFNN